MSGHTFLAVDLSDTERHALSAALAEASPGTQLPGKRPPPRNWHITLRFIGECSDVDADRIIYEVSRDLVATPGRVFVTGLGAFPRASRASVLYAAIDDRDGLLDHLSGVCEAAVRNIGFAPEERPFVPHLTLSRLRPPNDVRRLIDAFAPFRAPVDVTAITLFRTHPSDGGIRYDPIDTVALPSF
ncbi:MAG: RNA 2',3'-cyclic phosphodiesterase [Actinomycetota bacterium]